MAARWRQFVRVIGGTRRRVRRMDRARRDVWHTGDRP